MDHTELVLREELCRAAQLLYQRGYVVGHDGNLSLRLGEDRILITPSGVSKGRLEPDMLVVCDLEGRGHSGARHPSSGAGERRARSSRHRASTSAQDRRPPS